VKKDHQLIGLHL